MNDDKRQKLSEYLDGALPAAEAAALEMEIAKSPELLAELEELKAVAKLVKDLPNEPLPTGFRQRLQRRMDAGDAPAERRDWVFLAPAYRPFAAALSGLIVAIVVWDKVGERPLPVLPYDGAAVRTAAEAPASQVDLSKQIAGGGKAAGARSIGESLDYLRQKEELEKSLPLRDEDKAQDRKDDGFAATEALDIRPPAVELPTDAGREALVAKRERVRAKGMPLTEGSLSSLGESAQAPMGLAGSGAGLKNTAPDAGGFSRALAQAKPAAPAAAAPAPMEIAAVRGAAPQPSLPMAMSEEERSARNEEMYKAFEKEKKAMGIKGFAGKAESDAQRVLRASGAGDQPTRIDSLTPNLLGSKDGVLPRALRSESAFHDAWSALKLPGEPPAVDFTRSMVVVLPAPGALVDVKEGKKELVVTWKPLPAGGPADRLQSVELSGKPVRLVRRD